MTYGLIFNLVQANTVTIAFENAFAIDRLTMGIILAVLVAVIIFGGIRSIATISSLVVPPMAIVYIIVAAFIVITNISVMPEVLLSIVKGAFGAEQVIGGGVLVPL